MICAQQGRTAEGLEWLESALKINPNEPGALSHYGAALQVAERFEEALAIYDKVLAIAPNFVEALYNRGLALQHFKRFEDALASYDKALALKPGNVDALYNRGIMLWTLKRFAEALACYEALLKISPDFPEALNNRGIMLWNLKRYDEALANCDVMLARNPRSAEGWNDRGCILWDMKRLDEAVASYDKALAIRPDYAEALNNRGNALLNLERLADACASYEKALALDPHHAFAFGGLATVVLSLCDWQRAEKIAAKIPREVEAQAVVIPPLTLLGYCDDAALQLACAKRNIREKIPVMPQPLWDGTRYRHDRIRIAYLSSDFGQHPVSLQMAEFLERHDRSRFEVLGISTGLDDGTDFRARLIRSFDQFHDVRTENHPAVAALLRRLEVDILVDLGGHTRDSRIEIASHRPCPVQVSYLGYPGTIGADFVDYVIADPVVVPADQQVFYSEKILHLPGSFFVSDTRRAVAPAPSRAAMGLPEEGPEEGFVFCCFNNHWKITAPVFESWMRLLQAVPDSVLWFIEARKAMRPRENLRAAAAARGVDPARLFFAGKVESEAAHLGRYRAAGLFLDTLPYNAHATACDALWAGLPLITCRGKSFAGRVSASLLQAVGLPELVTDSLEDYEALALRLAREPELLRSFRDRLANPAAQPLFDIERFRKNIEAAYTQMRDAAQ